MPSDLKRHREDKNTIQQPPMKRCKSEGALDLSIPALHRQHAKVPPAKYFCSKTLKTVSVSIRRTEKGIPVHKSNITLLKQCGLFHYPNPRYPLRKCSSTPFLTMPLTTNPKPK